MRAQLERSRAECEAHLGRPCTSLAYPYGSATERVVRSARDAGRLRGRRHARPLASRDQGSTLVSPHRGLPRGQRHSLQSQDHRAPPSGLAAVASRSFVVARAPLSYASASRRLAAGTGGLGDGGVGCCCRSTPSIARPFVRTSPATTGTPGACPRTRRSRVVSPMPASSPHTITARLRGAQCSSEWTSRAVTAVRESIVPEWTRRSFARCCSVPPQSSTNSGCGGWATLIPSPLAGTWSGRIHPCNEIVDCAADVHVGVRVTIMSAKTGRRERA